MRNKILLFVMVILALGCREKFTPKPRGFFRISFPEKKYQPIENQFPYQFNIPQYVQVVPDYQNPGQPWWINLEVPENKAEVHISYFNLQNNTKPSREMLAEFMEETRELAYKHSVKANAIEERIFVNPEENVFGTVYRIGGNAASPIQFFLTDSTRHFLRGALYIKATPDIDSLKPVIEFLERDVIQIIETAKWK
ncbi:MAG: gliding motility lipoprotein GldD [Mariniphaga sp.]|nr:gliding motility lipoprotein GldD [Mariniphaga sp.]